VQIDLSSSSGHRGAGHGQGLLSNGGAGARATRRPEKDWNRTRRTWGIARDAHQRRISSRAGRIRSQRCRPDSCSSAQATAGRRRLLHRGRTRAAQLARARGARAATFYRAREGETVPSTAGTADLGVLTGRDGVWARMGFRAGSRPGQSGWGSGTGRCGRTGLELG
jgi:hypothetical protein